MSVEEKEGKANPTARPVKGPQGVDKDPEQERPGAPGSDFTTEQKGKKTDGDPQQEKDQPAKED